MHFYQGEYDFSPLLFSLSFPVLLAPLSHSFTFSFLFSPHPLSSVLAHPFLVLPPTHFPVLSFVSLYSSIWAIRFCLMRSCLSTMYLFSVLCCPGYSSQSTGLSEGLERFISKHYKCALFPAVLAPGSPALVISLHPHPPHPRPPDTAAP